MNAWKTYRPSNGIAGDRIIATVCRGCKQDPEDCDILDEALWHDLEDDEYPFEMQCRRTDRGYEIRCTAKRGEVEG